MKIRIAVLFGGQSTEHEVSRNSAAFIIDNISREKYDVYPIGITKSGKWIYYKGSVKNIESGYWEKDLQNSISNGETFLFNKKVDVVFPVLHGLYGEDGTIQGMCKLVNIPCVGSGVMASAICMDKVYTKYMLEKFNILQAQYVVVNNYDYKKNKDDIVKTIENNIGYNVFIKPSNSGSSVGITKAHNREELLCGIEEALKYDRKVLVEKAINAREIEVAVLGNDDPIATFPGEIIPSKEFYDYEAKYESEESKLLIPADLDEAKQKEISSLAVKIYKALDCAGMARVDFLVDKDNGKVFLNELNTIPGFTKISMYPKLWNESGKDYKELIEELINFAIERNNN